MPIKLSDEAAIASHLYAIHEAAQALDEISGRLGFKDASAIVNATGWIFHGWSMAQACINDDGYSGLKSNNGFETFDGRKSA
jgi:hypothetical protein